MVADRSSIRQRSRFAATLLSRVFAVVSVIVMLFAQQAAAITQDDIDCANQGGLSGTCFFQQAACTPDTPASTTSPSTVTTVDVTSIASKYNLQSVMVKKIGGSSPGSYKADQPPPSPASVLKLIIASVFLHSSPNLGSSVRVRSSELYGGHTPDGSTQDPKAGQSLSLHDALQQTLMNSSDTDANVLIDAAGGLSTVNSAAHRLGYNSTTIGSYYNSTGAVTIAKNETTVTDLTTAMEDIYTGSGNGYQIAQDALQNENQTWGLNSEANKWGGTSDVTGNSAVFKIDGDKYIITMYDTLNGEMGDTTPGAKPIRDATNEIVAALKSGASPTVGSLSYVAVGNIPFSGEDIGASTFGGSYVSGSWGPSNGVQGVQAPRSQDDNGQGNGSGSPAGHAAYAELDNGTALGNIPDHTKLAITYKGKTIIAEKLDVGGGGGPVNGKPREVDLWWEAAKLLDFTGGTDVINIRAVDPSTPATPVDGIATTSPGGSASETCACPDSSTPGSAATLTGSTNAEQAFNYFVSTMSLPPEAAAGLVGNFQQESGAGLDTHDNNGSHVGIVQWSNPGRWTSLISFESGKDPYALATQLDYVMHELTTGSYKTTVLPVLKSATTPQQASDVVFNIYEAPGDSSGPRRAANAQNLMNLYGHNPAFGPSPTTACDTSSTPGGAGPNGWDLSGANAMVYFGQCDPKWGSHPYGNPGQTSICESGCGITSLAMVVDTLTGKNETPLTLGNKYGPRYHTFGTSWSLWPVAANDFGLHMQDIGTNFTKAAQIIQSGGLVIGSFDIGFFTTAGHFMVLRSVNSSGQFYLADPNNAGAKALGRGDTNNTPYSTNFLTNQGALSHMWAFTK